MKIDILQLLDKNDFISGEKISKKLNISRTAVWKQIQVLKDLGYDIKAVKNKGYKLVSRPDIPLSEEILFNLNTKTIGSKIHYFKSLNSTNLYAKNLIKKKPLEGTVVVADTQTQGRGRKNRNWFSPEGGLWFSIILYPKIPTQYAMLVTMATSVSLVESINRLTGFSPKIKWPNDLLLKGKKICGILTELDAEMDMINYSIVGVGINVNNHIENGLIDKAAAIVDFYGKKISRVELLKLFLKYFDKNYLKLISKDYDFIRNLWFSYSDIIGKKVKLKRENSEIVGIVDDIDDTGCLILNVVDKKIKIVSGDLEFI
jgi:BirA family biotin operon repressor/biotin-[acetyl-CoA-carboxylase] ligase